MALTEVEIEKRILLWVAMSFLWNDNEFDKDDLDCLVFEMLQSGFPMEKLERIFLREVAPVCWGNILSWSVWSGFDAEWLTENILKNIEKQNRNPLYRCYVKSWLAYFITAKLIWEDWEKAKTIYQKSSKNIE